MARLKYSNDNIYKIIDAIYISIYWKDQAGNYLGCNQHMLNMAKVACRKEIIGKTDYDLWWKIDAHKLRKADMLAMETGYFHGEEYLNLPHGKQKVYLSTKTRLVDKNGNVLGIVGSSTDITAHRKKLELEKQQVILDERIRTSQIIDMVNASIYWKDVNGKVMGCNKYMLNMFGIDNKADIIGKTDFDLYKSSKEIAHMIRDMDISVMTNGPYESEEKAILNGQKKFYLSAKNRLLDSKNNVIGVVGVSVDITELKEAALIKAAEEQAKAESEEKFSRVVTTHANAIVHNLSSPLYCISVAIESDYSHYIKLLLNVYKEAKRYGLESTNHINENCINYLQNEHINLIKDSTFKMSKIISSNLTNLRQAIKIHHGETETIKLVKCNIRDSVNTVNWNGIFTEKECKLIHVDIEDNSFNYMGNIITVNQIINNIINNALYQIKQNGRGEIFITAESIGASNILRIKDTAGGASVAIVEKMFDSHYTTKPNGNGVGLDFCRKMMELMGGYITARSEYGEYMEIILYFPILKKISNQN